MEKIENKDIRKVQLELLLNLDAFLKEKKLTYFLFAGTLLGAVRHKGFIPWDDDIDLAMPREDYEKLTHILSNEESNEKFRLLCFENNKDYFWQFGKIIDKRTYMKTKGGHQKLGISIDVFPLDSQGNNRYKAQKYLEKIHEYVNLRRMSYINKYSKFSFPKCKFRKKIYYMFEFFILGRKEEKYWVKRTIDAAMRLNTIKDSCYYGCNSNEKYVVVTERNNYDSTVLLDFEGQKLPAPIGYDNILKAYYGDYMKLPPEEKRVGLESTNFYWKEA